MKTQTISLFIALCLISHQINSQTFNEIFQQKRTQKTYLIKQIALFQLYMGYLKKGYEIAHGGLTAIENIKNGDFNLHRDFFASLKNVNPAIVNSAKVADIIAFQVFIVKSIRKTNSFCNNNKQFTAEEILYVSRVYSNMVKLTDASVSELFTLISAGQAEMKDDERLRRIDKLYDDMLDKHAFVKSIDGDLHQIAAERSAERRRLQETARQYDII